MSEVKTGLFRKFLNKKGREVLSDKPMALPLGFKRPETLDEQIQRMVRTRVSAMAADQGFDTWEDANDFDIDDDTDPLERHFTGPTPYETHFDPDLGREFTDAEVARSPRAFVEEYAVKSKRKPAKGDPASSATSTPSASDGGAVAPHTAKATSSDSSSE